MFLAVSAKGSSIASGCRGGRIASGICQEARTETWAAVGSRVEHLLWSPEKAQKPFRRGQEGILKLSEAI